MSTVITLSRQFSTGGREIGKRLSDRLGYSYYDKELIEMLAEENGLSREYLEHFNEKIVKHYPMTTGRTFVRPYQSPTDTIYTLQAKIINQLAEENDCVIVGRCADYILRDTKAFKVFVYSSSMDARIERCYTKVPEDRAKTSKEMHKKILEVDKRRSRYYNYYTGRKWSNMENYNLCIDTAKIDIKTAVELIACAIERQG